MVRQRVADGGTERLLTLQDAARQLAIGGRTLRALVAAGIIPVVRVSRRRLAIDPADLAVYVAKRRVVGGVRGLPA